MSEGGLISVALPGPWWTQLTYRTHLPCETGARVRVPVGRSSRVGLVLAGGDAASGGYEGEIREVAGLLDERPLLPGTIMPLLSWFSDTYLCGVGMAMKTLLPSAFLRGDAPDPGQGDPASARGGAGRVAYSPDASFVYDPADHDRYARYAGMLSDGMPALVAFPLYSSAKNFFEFLTTSAAFPDELKKRALLFPHSGAKAEWRAWSRLMSDPSPKIVVGAQSSAMAPVANLGRVIVEDESNNIWRTMRPPIYNVRSLLAKRARLEGASLVLGGRMPSSRAYLRLLESGRLPPKRGRKIFYVDQREAYSPQVEGVQDSLAVSEPLVRETNAALERGAWAIWILDRKGYAGEIVCEECGAAVGCSKCGGVMRWEAPARAEPRVRCVACGVTGALPDICPHCRGRLLSARRPGLEALLPLARAAIHHPVPILSLEEEGGGVPDKKTAPRAGLLIGTRAALALCDKLHVGLVGWIDPDGEARSQEYDAKLRAFGLIWESCWRGLKPEERRVLLQSRRPGRDWQRGLAEGWQIFWRGEIRERRRFNLPPFLPLIRLEVAASDARALRAAADREGIDYWEADESGGKRMRIWIRTSRMGLLRALLAPLFDIGSKKGYPGVTVWYD